MQAFEEAASEPVGLPAAPDLDEFLGSSPL
jgi:hypothetical protein